MKRSAIWIFVLLVLALLVGCQTLKFAPLAEAGKAVPSDSIVVAGKITLDPEPEQKFEYSGLGVGVKESFIATYGQRFFALLSKQPAQKIEDMTKADLIIDERWNEYFVAVLPRTSLNWVTVQVRLKQNGPDYDDLFLNSPFEIAYQSTDRFVYLGDFVYHFNVTNQLGGKETVLEIKDGYDAAKKKLDGSILGQDGKALVLERRIARNVAKLQTDVIGTRVHYY